MQSWLKNRDPQVLVEITELIHVVIHVAGKIFNVLVVELSESHFSKHILSFWVIFGLPVFCEVTVCVMVTHEQSWGRETLNTSSYIAHSLWLNMNSSHSIWCTWDFAWLVEWAWESILEAPKDLLSELMLYSEFSRPGYPLHCPNLIHFNCY